MSKTKTKEPETFNVTGSFAATGSLALPGGGRGMALPSLVAAGPSLVAAPPPADQESLALPPMALPSLVAQKECLIAFDPSGPDRSFGAPETEVDPISPPGARMGGITHVNKDTRETYVRCVAESTGGLYFRRKYISLPVDTPELADALVKELQVFGWHCIAVLDGIRPYVRVYK